MLQHGEAWIPLHLSLRYAGLLEIQLVELRSAVCGITLVGRAGRAAEAVR